MVRRLALVALVAASLPVAVAAAGAQTAAPSDPALYVDGDSLGVGTMLYLPRELEGWAIRARTKVGRTTAQGVLAVRRLGPALPPVVVVQLGTNDDPSEVAAFEANVRAVLAAAGPRRCVVWSTIARPAYRGSSYAAFNRVLARLDASSRTLRVYDWRATTATQPGLLRADRVHATLAGYRERARALAELVRGC